MRQRCVNQRLQAPHQIGHALGLGARGLLVQQGLALGVAAQPLGHIGDEARHEHLAADVHLGHGRLAREATPVATHELHLEALGRERRVALDQRAAALVVALAELRRDHQRAHRLADRLCRAPAEEPVGRGVPAQDHAFAVERDEGVGSRVEHEPGARLRALEQLGAIAQPAQQRGDEQPGEQWGAHRQQPAHDRAVGGLDHEHDRVRDRHHHHVSERLDRPEEVEGVERRPHVEQRVERGRPRVVVREAHDQHAGDEHHVDVPVANVVAARPDHRGDQDRRRREQHQREVVHLVRVREHQGEQPEDRARPEQIGDRARLDADVEQLRKGPHRREPRKRCRRLAPRGARAPRGIRPRAA